MKHIKKLMGLLVLTTAMVCSGCGSIGNQKLTPVEASGEQIVGTGISVDLPKGWSEREGMLTQSGFTITKGTSTITVLKEDVPGLSEQDIDTTLANLQAVFESTTDGVNLLDSEAKTLEVGDAVTFRLEATVTQDLVDENINSGLLTEEATKNAKSLIGKTNNEVLMCICIGDTLVTIDGVTYTGDAEGIEEVVTFIANSITLS